MESLKLVQILALHKWLVIIAVAIHNSVGVLCGTTFCTCSCTAKKKHDLSSKLASKESLQYQDSSLQRHKMLISDTITSELWYFIWFYLLLSCRHNLTLILTIPHNCWDTCVSPTSCWSRCRTGRWTTTPVPSACPRWRSERHETLTDTTILLLNDDDDDGVSVQFPWQSRPWKLLHQHAEAPCGECQGFLSSMSFNQWVLLDGYSIQSFIPGVWDSHQDGLRQKEERSGRSGPAAERRSVHGSVPSSWG